MREFLILKLQGPMQAWGEHSFEGLRPSANFPTRSGVLGLLGACLGIKRNERHKLQELADSIGMAVRVDTRILSRKDGSSRKLGLVKAIDYHTIQDARSVYEGRKKPHQTIQTWREYLYDAEFTIALWNHQNAVVSLEQLEKSAKQPIFTPYLGRRSCPVARPLFQELLESLNSFEALKKVAPYKGTIFSEEKTDTTDVRMMRVRDVPLVQQPRQFGGRNIYIHGGEHVPE